MTDSISHGLGYHTYLTQFQENDRKIQQAMDNLEAIDKEIGSVLKEHIKQCMEHVENYRRSVK